jgi:dUTP pyrophosphatase
MEILKVKKLNDLATLPSKGSPKSAAYDLCSTEDYTLMPMERKLFKTGLSIAIPSGMYGRIAPRSGLAFKDGIDVLAGVVDEDYRGEVGVVLINFSTVEKKFKVGDKIAQMIFEFYNIVEVIEVKDLDETVRGEGGWGSTDTTSKDVWAEKQKISEIFHSQGIAATSSFIPIKSQPGEAKSSPPVKNYESHVDLIDQWKKAGGTTEHPSTTYEKLIRDREKNIGVS